MNSKRWKKHIFSTLSFIVSGGLLYWIISKIDVTRTQHLLNEANASWLLIALILAFGIPLLATVRWLGVIRAQDILNIRPHVALRAVMLAMVLNSFLPSKAGDLAKVVFLKKHSGFSTSVGTVVLERLVDLFALGILGMVGFFWSGNVLGGYAASVLLGGVSATLLIITIIPLHRIPISLHFQEAIKKIHMVCLNWLKNPLAILQTLAGSFGIWTINGMIVFSLVMALGADHCWSYAISIFPVAVIAGQIPISISGIGTRDSVFVLLLSVHLSFEEATLIAIGYTVFSYWLLSLICFPIILLEIIKYFRSSDRINQRQLLKE